jgi:hypothetical protein
VGVEATNLSLRPVNIDIKVDIDFQGLTGHITAMGQGGLRAVQECQDGALWTLSNDEFERETDNAVLLNVYDLNEDWLQTNDIFSETLEIGGAFHAGVEVYGQEWSFSPDGICQSAPRYHEVHVFRTSILIGYTKYSYDELACIIEDQLCGRWPGKSYDLLARNCCSFARSFCKRIAGKNIPDWVDRLPRVANTLTKPALGVVDFAADVAMSYAPGRDFSLDSDDFSIASSVCSTPAPTPKANRDLTFAVRRTACL